MAQKNSMPKPNFGIKNDTTLSILVPNSSMSNFGNIALGAKFHIQFGNCHTCHIVQVIYFASNNEMNFNSIVLISNCPKMASNWCNIVAIIIIIICLLIP